jgi:alkanesulfonate monooxygenase SsuD/methylene tetrahydromethanopterin reductase-like flavin-dependent oxidoreductase (luciferase family)
LNATDEAVAKQIENTGQRIPRRTVEEITAAGDTEHCIKKFAQYIRAGATSITASFVGPNTVRAIKTCGREVIPHLREQYGD